MATTGTYTYNITGEDLIEDALRLLGVLEEGGTISTAQITDSLPAFEMYLKSMTKYGLNLWTINSQGEQITLVDGTSSYKTTNPAIKILECYYRDSDGNDSTMIPLTRQEYWNLADKDQSGQPTQYFFDPKDDATDTSSNTIYVWPVPDSSFADDLYVVYQTYIQDASADTTTADEHINVPSEWMETIKYGLATRLAPMYGYPVQERNLLNQEYMLMLKENLDWDTEQESIYLRPEAGYGN
jgi:hypothetical protein